MELPKKISPDNLIETIVEIRMNPTCPPELWAGMLSVRLMNLGYEYIPAPQLGVRLDKNGKMAVSAGKMKENVPSGIFVKGHVRFVMEGNSISFNCSLGHYAGWSVYKDEIRNVVAAVQECGIANDFNRGQIRYISEYAGIDILEHIRGTIVVGTSDNPFRNQEIKLNKMDGNTKVFVSLTNRAMRKNADGEYASSLFDVNVYENFETSDIGKLMELLDKIHRVEKETFFGLLKDEFIQSLKPEY